MKKYRELIIFIICYVAYTSIYMTRINLSMASPGLIDGGILDSAQIGMMGSAFSVVYAFGRIISGGIGDKQPPWIMISIGLLVAGVSNIATGLFPPFIAIMLLWMSNAFAQSMLWGSVLNVMSAIYDEKKVKKMASYMVTSVAMGNIAAILLTPFIIEKLSLAFAFIVPGCLTLIMSTIVVLSLRKIQVKAELKEHKSFFGLLKEKKIKQLLLPAVFHGVMKDNVSLWMAVYFVQMFGIDLEESALFVLFIPVVGLIGRLLYTPCYKLCKSNEHLVSVMAFVICILSAVPLMLGFVTPVTAAIALSLIYAAVSLVNTSMLTFFPIRFLDSGNVSSVSGIMDFATYFGAGIGSFAYGFVIKAVGYTPMFASWIIISLISIIILYSLLNKDKKSA